MAGMNKTVGELRYGPGGGVYRVTVTPEQTSNTHFAFEATEPPGGGPPLCTSRTARRNSSSCSRERSPSG
jgi:hypothetical protein